MKNSKMLNHKLLAIIFLILGGFSVACSHQEVRSPASESETISIEDLTLFHTQCNADKDCLISKIQDESLIPSVKVYRSPNCSSANNGGGFTFRGDINGQMTSAAKVSCRTMVPSLAANKYVTTKEQYGSAIGSAKLQSGDCVELYHRVDLSALCNYSTLVEIEGKLLKYKK